MGTEEINFLIFYMAKRHLTKNAKTENYKDYASLLQGLSVSPLFLWSKSYIFRVTYLM